MNGLLPLLTASIRRTALVGTNQRNSGGEYLGKFGVVLNVSLGDRKSNKPISQHFQCVNLSIYILTCLQGKSMQVRYPHWAKQTESSRPRSTDNWFDCCCSPQRLWWVNSQLGPKWNVLSTKKIIFCPFFPNKQQTEKNRSHLCSCQKWHCSSSWRPKISGEWHCLAEVAQSSKHRLWRYQCCVYANQNSEVWQEVLHCGGVGRQK